MNCDKYTMPANSPSVTTIETKQQISAKVVCGMLTGMSIATIFHPWDRALYLAMANNRSFLYDKKNNKFVAENFSKPFQGFMQTLFSRTVSNSIYFVAQNQMNTLIYPWLRHDCGLYEWQAQLGVGLSVGSINGIITNSLYAIRSQTWNTPNSTFFSSAWKMWSEGGVKPFMKGISATVTRDATFGIIYEVLRHWGTEEEIANNSSQFMRNAAAAGLATIFSGPFNYVRNIQFATPPDQTPPKITKALNTLWQESQAQETLLERIGFFPKKLQVGPGTARVAFGMATGQYLYNSFMRISNGNNE
jgi:hypothetical protein